MSTKVSNKLIISWLVSIGIPLIIVMIPVNDVFTTQIRTFLACTLWMILAVALECFPTGSIIPAFLYPVLLTLTKTCTVPVAYSSWTSQVTFVFFMAFALANALQDCGLLERIAYWCIVKVGGTFMGVYYGLFIVCLICTIITMGNSYVFLAAFTYGVIVNMGMKCGKSSALMTFSALLGTMTVRLFVWSPQKGGQITEAANKVIEGFSVEIFNQLYIEAPVILFTILILVLLPKLVKKEERTLAFDADIFKRKLADLGPLSTRERKASVILILMCIYILLQPLHGMNINYVYLIFVPLMWFPLIEVAGKEALKNVDWCMVFFMVSCMGIGSVGTAIGVGDMISEYLSPILMGLSPRLASFVTLMFTTILNFILTPTAMYSALPGPLAQIALDIGVSPEILIYHVINGADLIFLPYESVPYLIFFSFGMVHMKDFIRVQALKIFCFFVFLWIVIFPYWNLIGLL